MASQEAQFKKASEIVRALPQDGDIKSTQSERLEFYKYFKQGSVGDVNTSQPGITHPSDRAKWDAWKSVEGTSKADAQGLYVKQLLKILNASGHPDATKYIVQIEEAH